MNDAAPFVTDRYSPKVAAPRFLLEPFATIKPENGAPYLIKGLLPSTGLAVIWGAPKCGKSFWVADALLHVALGWPYRGHRVIQGAVVYCALEGAAGFKNRIEAFRMARLAEATDATPPFFLMATPLSLVADHAALIGDIKKQLGETKPVAVCIDTLNRSIAGSENDDEAMGAYVRAAGAIHAAFNCLVPVVHHSGYSAERPRGHSSLVGALDVQIGVKRDAAGNIIAELELAKDAPVGLQFVSRLKVVEIGSDQDGDPITSCVVEALEWHEVTPVDKGQRLSNKAQIALQALAKAIDEVGETPSASNHIPASTRVVTVKQWRNYADQCGISETDNEDARRVAFKRGHDELLAKCRAKAHGEYRWRAN